MIEIIGEPRDATEEEIRNYKQKCQELDQQTEGKKNIRIHNHRNGSSACWTTF